MARDRLSSDYSENMSDATTCSCMVSSVEKCSVRSCVSMFQEPFFLHPPGSRPRDGLYINPMSASFGRQAKEPGVPTNGASSNGSESFYLHSPHELVYTRVAHLFDESTAPTATTPSERASSASSSRASADRRDETLTVKVDVHINNGSYKPMGNGGSSSPPVSSGTGSPRPEHPAKADSGSEHAYEQICIRQEEQPPAQTARHKKLAPADNVSDGSRSHKADRRYSRSSSASESSNLSSEVHYSSATSTPSLSRNSSNERMSKSPKLPEILMERKNSSTSSTRAESEKETKPAIAGGASGIFRPPPPPPPPPPEIEEVVIVTSKLVESTVKEERKDGSQSTTQQQKCESTITTISATNKSAAGEAAGASSAAGGPTPELPVGSGQPPASIVDDDDDDDDDDDEDEDNEAEEESTRTRSTTTTTTTSACQVTAHLVNRHMVLPFIPPKFAAQSGDSDTLLKPSEYLRSICKAAAAGGPNTGSLSKARSVDNLDIQGRGGCKEEEEEEERQQREPEPSEPSEGRSGPPPPPLPPPPGNGLNAANPPSAPLGPTPESRQAQQKLQQPLATISIQDLTSVQLRRTNLKMHATKTFSAPPNRSVSMTNVSEAFFVQKTDLIAELKKTKDIPGIKKLKVERAQNEKSQEQNLISEISKNFNASHFVDQIPEKDSAGNVIPIWKRQMLARKAAERAKKELEEKIARENEEKRIQSIPPWKRQLLARKDSEYKGTGLAPAQALAAAAPTTKPEGAAIPRREPIPETAAPAQEEDRAPAAQQPEEKRREPEPEEPESAHIIPWRAQLRKTNSKLNILD